MAETVRDVLFAKQVLKSMRPGVQEETVAVYEDKGDAIRLDNPTGSARSKHIDICRVRRDVVREGDIRIVRAETQLHHADMLAKSHTSEAYRKHGSRVMNLTLDGMKLT